jgi:hypothetical protein
MDQDFAGAGGCPEEIGEGGFGGGVDGGAAEIREPAEPHHAPLVLR